MESLNCNAPKVKKLVELPEIVYSTLLLLLIHSSLSCSSEVFHKQTLKT